jgi:23S rRNA pseudouridine1911/1915/1917 synthase
MATLSSGRSSKLYAPDPLSGPGGEGGLPLNDASAADVDDAAWPSFEARVGQADHGLRLDQWLAKMQPQFSRSHWQKLIDAKQVHVDDAVAASAKQALRAGQHVQASLEPPASETSFVPEPVPLEVVFEDETVLVLNKPAGLVVHPAAGNWRGTVLNGLLHRWPQLGRVPRAGIVHRLDKLTSGLMVVAKTVEAQWALVQQLQRKDVARVYLALAHGTVAQAGRVLADIGRDPASRTRMAVVVQHGKPAATRYTPLAAGSLDGRPVTLLRCELETGRTHQIRVHMAHAGHPLVGDVLYGGESTAAGFDRQALHAWQLGLTHPGSGLAMQWCSGLPQDMQQLLASAGINPAQWVASR